MKDVKELMMIVGAILVLFGLGAYFSPTYMQQISYIEGLLLTIALIFVVSVVIIIATIGSQTFALYVAILTSLAIATFGLYGGFLVLILTYIVWGFAFGVELLLVYHDAKSAIDWFVTHYTYTQFIREYYLFYPMVWILYILLDIVPGIIYRDTTLGFRPQKARKKIQKIFGE